MKLMVIGLAAVAGVLVLALALAWIAGRALPVAHVAEAHRHLALDRATVAAAIRDVAGHPRWRSGVRAVSVSELGNGWRGVVEDGPHGALPYRIRETSADAGFETVIDDPALPFGGRWTFALRDADGGTDVTLREEGEVRNPLFRFLARHVFGHERSIRTYLDDLQRLGNPTR
jgi:hypothetical protein